MARWHRHTTRLDEVAVGARLDRDFKAAAAGIGLPLDGLQSGWETESAPMSGRRFGRARTPYRTTLLAGDDLLAVAEVAGDGPSEVSFFERSRVVVQEHRTMNGDSGEGIDIIGVRFDAPDTTTTFVPLGSDEAGFAARDALGIFR